MSEMSDETKSTALPSGKGLCDKCGFVVKLAGHIERCRVVDAAVVLRQRKLAWLGDAAHIYCVRWFVLELNVEVGFTQKLAQEFISADGQAEFFRLYLGPREKVLSSSQHAVATAFEASFYLHDQFRKDYVNYLVLQFSMNLADITRIRLLSALDALCAVALVCK